MRDSKHHYFALMEKNDGKIMSTANNCDYFMIGAGTAVMYFINIVLSEHSKAQIILVDINSKPGGHWTNSYGSMRMHQPSCNYSVNSLPLGTTCDFGGNEHLDIDDRATGSDIFEYYTEVHESFQTSGRVRSFFSSKYFQKEDNYDEAVDQKYDYFLPFQTKSGDKLYVKCKKLVKIRSKAIVQSMRDHSSFFPAHESINYIPI